MSDKFNSNIKDAFDGLENSIDPELIWKGINASMEQSKKKKRRLFVWWFFGFGFVSILLFSMMYSFDSNNEGGLQIVSSESSVGDNSSESAMPINETKIFSDRIGTEHSRSQEYNDLQSINAQEQIKNNSKVVFDVNADQFLAKEDPDASKNDKPLNWAEESNADLSINLNATKRVIPIVDIDKNTLIENSRNEIADVYKLSESLNVYVQSNEVGESTLDEIYPTIRLDEETNDVRFLNSFEVYNGISFGSKSITSSNQAYNENRNRYEKLLEQLHFGTRFQLIQFQDFKFLTGLKYSRINDNWTMNLEYTEDVPFTYVEYQTEYPDGFIEDEFTTETLSHLVRRYVDQYNTEKILSLPLELRFGKQLDNWSFGIGAGLEVSYLFSANHTVIGLDGLPANISTEGKWLNPTISAGIFTSYAISPQWSITGNLNYRKISTNSNAILPDLKSTYSLFGLELGIARRFNR